MQRTLFGLVSAANQVVIDQPVQDAAHFSEAFVGIDHDRFRGPETLSGFQVPAEISRIDPRDETGRVLKIAFCGDLEVSAVDQAEAVCISLFLPGSVPK